MTDASTAPVPSSAVAGVGPKAEPLTQKEAYDAMIEAFEIFARAVPLKEQKRVMAEAVRMAEPAIQFLRGPLTNAPATLAAALNFFGVRSQSLATVFDPDGLGVLVVWGKCGCHLHVSPLCRVGIDHRADAQYEVEIAEKTAKSAPPPKAGTLESFPPPPAEPPAAAPAEAARDG